MPKMTKAEALRAGFTIDHQASVAYKGPRFSPSEWHPVFTDLEYELLTTMSSIINIPAGLDALSIGRRLRQCIATHAPDYKP